MQKPLKKRAEDLYRELMSRNAFFERAQHHINMAKESRRWDIYNANRRAYTSIEDVPEPCMNLNVIPTSKSIRRQIIEGIISYSYEFNTKPNNLFDDTLSESFTTSWTYPNDIFSQVTIPGRQSGPLIFSANTMTAPKYALNFEIVLKPQCPSDGISKLPMRFENNLDFNKTVDTLRIHTSIMDSQIYGLNTCRQRMRAVAKVHFDYLKGIGMSIRKIESDNDSWNATEGRYSGSITFVLGTCGGYVLNPLSRYFKTEDNKKSAMA